MVYWLERPPRGPFSKSASAVLLILAIVMTIPVVLMIVLGAIGLVQWLFR
jgi:hypothetical protein